MEPGQLCPTRIQLWSQPPVADLRYPVDGPGVICEAVRMQPADFYTGIVAELYSSLKSEEWDPAKYASFIREYGEPALELGCGDGDPLLDLCQWGFDVDGIDSSADMLDRCRRKAAGAGIDVTVCHQRMEELDLPRRYRSIFLAGPTLTLLPDDDTALQALRRIHAHLPDDGAALAPLFIPSPTSAERFHRMRQARGSDGAVLGVSTVAEDRDESTRTQVTTLRYQRGTGDAAEPDVTIDRPWTLHWYTPEGFSALATAAGLTAIRVEDDDRAVADGDFTFLLRHRQG